MVYLRKNEKIAMDALLGAATERLAPRRIAKQPVESARDLTRIMRSREKAAIQLRANLLTEPCGVRSQDRCAFPHGLGRGQPETFL